MPSRQKSIKVCLCLPGNFIFVGECTFAYLSLAPELLPPCALDPSPSENLCMMRKPPIFSQYSHRGSSDPLCMSRCPFGISSPSHFLQPCISEMLLAFPPASVIRCKGGCDTKMTLLSPRMDFLQLTHIHTTAMHSLLI